MEYDVFISHSSVNEDHVRPLCSYLENKGLKCFVSYRDIPSGVSYPGAITRALRESEMLLLVLSEASNESTQVDRELTLANDQKMKLSCFRLEDIAYSDDKAYLMSGVNWLDAFPSPEEHYFELLQDICRHLGREVPEEEETEEAMLDRYKNQLGSLLYDAANGRIEAQFDLGRAYDQGLYGLNKDEEEAFRWFLKAAKKGHIKAENDIGVAYARGAGVEKNMMEAVKWWKLSALSGNEVAQSNLAYMYSKGEIGEKNLAEAVKWWKLSADQAYDPAMLSLGNCYYFGNGVEQDYVRAVEYYERAAKLDNDDAQVNLAECYRDGEGVEQNIEKCIDILKSAIDNNSTRAMVELAEIYEEGQLIEPDFQKAFYYMKSAAEKGNLEALYKLSRYYQTGIGCERDLKMWFECLEQAAIEGHAWSQDDLGDVYSTGNPKAGIQPDPQRALYWYQKAIDQGNTDAMVDLGLCYSNGGCLPLNETKAAELFKQAAEEGNARGQYMLADEYQQGNGVKQSDQEAFYWMTKSAEQELILAIATLGEYYFYGLGTEQNFSRAVELLTVAANAGDPDALYLLGVCYEFGYGVDKSINEALTNYGRSPRRKAKESFERLAASITNAEDKGLNGESLFELGCYYSYDVNDLEKGISYFLKAAEKGNERAYNEIAWNYHLTGRYEEGLEWAKKAVNSDKTNAHAADTLASLYEDLKMYKEALSTFEECLSLYNQQNNDRGIEETKTKIERVKEKLSTH